MGEMDLPSYATIEGRGSDLAAAVLFYVLASSFSQNSPVTTTIRVSGWVLGGRSAYGAPSRLPSSSRVRESNLSD